MSDSLAELFLKFREWDGRDAEFIGPVEPPMVRWVRKGCPKSPWQIAVDERAGAAAKPPIPVQLSFNFDEAA